MHITDEDIIYYKEDHFKISIPELVKTYSINNIDDLKYLLDENGYYGRNKIMKYLNKKKNNISYTVKIYLPDSIKEYNWPIEGAYCIYQNKYIDKNKNTFYPFYQTAMYELKEKEKAKHSIEDIQMYCSNLGVKGRKMITHFLKYGIIKNGKMIISKKDIPEVYQNLFDNTWIY